MAWYISFQYIVENKVKKDDQTESHFLGTSIIILWSDGNSVKFDEILYN